MTDQYGFGYPSAPNPTVSEIVIERVAATLDRPAAAVEPPLGDVIDPEALDRLFDGRDDETPGPARVTFVFAGCQVVVDRSGTVEVTPID